jgi:hypothetical protein
MKILCSCWSYQPRFLSFPFGIRPGLYLTLLDPLDEPENQVFIPLILCRPALVAWRLCIALFHHHNCLTSSKKKVELGYASSLPVFSISNVGVGKVSRRIQQSRQNLLNISSMSIIQNQLQILCVLSNIMRLKGTV